MTPFEPYTPDSMMWRINRERLVLLSGPWAAVLQAAHPQVAMGVAAHSRFREDSTGRLRRTLDAVYVVAFGNAAEVARVRDAVARVHRPVRGTSPGVYSAADPGAQLWVLATLIMASVTMFQRFVAPLSDDELDLFLRENVPFGEVFGVAPGALPTTWSELEVYWRGMIEGPLLGSHPLCGEVARAAIRPSSPWHMRALAPVFRALALEYLPPHLRERLGLTDGPSRRWLWTLLDGVVPPLLRVAPSSLRYAPRYLSVRHSAALIGQSSAL
jgi:uncharacterized protein (DUF2236 family)